MNHTNTSKKRDVAFIVAFGFQFYQMCMLLFRAYVFTCLWDWFIVPTFGYRSVDVATATGVMLLYWLVAMSYNDVEGNDKKWPELLGFMFIHPTLVLCCGWLLHVFVEAMYML